MTEKKTVGEVSEETQKIQEFLQRCQPGDEIPYDRIAAETGIAMDYSGRQRIRRAAKRAGVLVEVIRNHGIRIASPDNAVGILVWRLGKIDNAVKRAETTHETIQEKFIREMTPEDRNRVLYVGAIFGAIRVTAEYSKYIYQEEQKRKIVTASVPIISIPFREPRDDEARPLSG